MRFNLCVKFMTFSFLPFFLFLRNNEGSEQRVEEYSFIFIFLFLQNGWVGIACTQKHFDTSSSQFALKKKIDDF